MSSLTSPRLRIIVDMQGAQTTGSRKRGIGRYTFSLAQALVRQRAQHEIILVLNGAFPDAVDWLRAEFDGLLTPDQIRLWQAPGPIDAMKPGNAWRRDSAELLREAFIASLEPDYVIVTSLFEGLGDDAATSVAKLHRAVPTAVILYDLIPLIQRKLYLNNPIQEAWYESKLDSLRRADLLLAISDSSRREAIDHLGFEPDACVNISTAADAHFVPVAPSAAQAQALRARYGLGGRYVMYTGGIDHRKNIDGLVRAYAALPGAVRAGLQLAVVCSIQDHNRAELERLAAGVGLAKGELVLTGFVPEDDLVLLYNLCTVFVFPSWHEGFGLPALEAMSCGRAVIAANTSSLPEVIGRDDALFDPRDLVSISDKLEQVLTDDAFRHELEQHGLRQARAFSWDLTARRAIAAIEQAPSRRSTPGLAMPLRRPRLAYVSPLPPERSGIADYSAELLPELGRHYEIDVVAPQASVSDPWVKANCRVRSVDWFREHAGRYDRVLYHMGNSAFHSHVFGLVEEIPGVVVLHDFFLSGVASRLESTGAEPGFWTAALYDSHGYPAVARRFADPVPEVVAAYPCNLPVLRAALNVIVHSDNSMRLARDWYGPAAADGWRLVPHLRVPAQLAQQALRRQARQALGLDADSLVVCSFGLLGPSKLNDRLLSAWLATLARNPDCVLVFVGENAAGGYGADLLAAIAASPARDRIRITGWADTELYRQYLAVADIGVQLRADSRGETSGTVLDCMNYGLATIVNAHGSLADLPDDAVLKLPDPFLDEQLQAALLRMRDDPAERQRLAECSRERILTAHTPRHCADQYAQAIEQAYHDARRGPVALVEAVAQFDAGPGSEQDLVRFSQALAQCLPPRLRLRQRLVEVDLAQRLPDDAAAELAQRLRAPSRDERVEPVYVDKEGLVRYARSFALQLLGEAAQALPDEVADCHHGDVFVALPYEGSRVRADALKNLQRRGVDLLQAIPESGAST
jgi:glycosyltransferase involved in cell wall biosynthesis